MHYSYCLICHRPAVDGLVLSFNCDPTGAIDGLCTNHADKPIAICKNCHAELICLTEPSNRLISNSSGEYYWTFGFPGVEREAKNIATLDKRHIKFLLTMIPDPPPELVALSEPETSTINENKPDHI